MNIMHDGGQMGKEKGGIFPFSPETGSCTFLVARVLRQLYFCG
jgi:hypothetical protein